MPFNWDANTYDDKFNFISTHGEDLISLLCPQEGEKILDIGCGTGTLSYKIAQEGAKVIGIDASKEMVEAARDKFPGLEFYNIFAESLNSENEFDAVFSNAVFHWIPDQEQVVKNIYKSLKIGGRLVVEFGAKGNCHNILSAVRMKISEYGYPISETLHFRSIAEFASMLERNNFYVDYAVVFDRETELEGEDGMKNWLTMFASDVLKNVPKHLHEKILDGVVEATRPKLYQNKKWYADYKRLRITAHK